MIPHVNETKNDLEDVDLQYTKEKSETIKWYHQVLLNRPLRVIIALVLFAILAPVLLYQFVFFAGSDYRTSDGFSLGSCLVPRESRLNCGLGNVTSGECHPQCCYDFRNNICFHRFPSRFSYIMDWHWAEEVPLNPRVATVPFKSQNSLTNIRLSLDEVSATHLTITFYNSAEISLTGRRIEDKEYFYEIIAPELNIVINSAQRNVFNTVRGPLIASENIWEVAFKLTEERMYGFGEIPIKTETVKMIYNHKNGPSSIPLIYAKVNDSYHGLLIDAVEPTEVSFGADNVIVVRSITNFGLKFHVFTGPKPADVMKDVMKFVGFKNEVEYWMLGAHVCSELDPEEDLPSSIRDFISEATEQNMPFESHCVKPIVFDSECEKEPVAEVNGGATLLHNAGKKFIPHVSPHILYKIKTVENETNSENNEMEKRNQNNCSYNIEDYSDQMLRDANSTQVYIGLVGNEEVIYPDYDNITDEFIKNLWVYTTDIDGVMLHDVWPLDDSEKFVNETEFYLPYFSENFEAAFYRTPQWNATNTNGKRYLYKHNEYGNNFARAFEPIKASPAWASSQRLNGDVHIHRQDIATSWTNLQKELIEAALGGISGHWFFSSPVCGDTDNFNADTHTSLCVKWYMAASYMPMIKIHSKGTGRDPLSFTGTHRTLMINALKKRLVLAPYFYTTFQDGPLLRPMFYQFPESEALKDLTSQFSVGNDLLIVPNLLPSQSMVHVTKPPGVWYELWSGLKLHGQEGHSVTMATTEADFLTLVREGSIVVMQKEAKLTAETTRAQTNLSLTIALLCETPDKRRNIAEKKITECSASGTLYMASNTSIHFTSDHEILSITATGDYDIFCNETIHLWTHTIQDLIIFGLEDIMNNYDHHRHVSTAINLCELKSQDEINFDFTL